MKVVFRRGSTHFLRKSVFKLFMQVASIFANKKKSFNFNITKILIQRVCGLDDPLSLVYGHYRLKRSRIIPADCDRGKNVVASAFTAR